MAKMTPSDAFADVDIGVREVLAPLFGKTCCRLRAGRMRSLSIGFGEKRYHGHSDQADDFYGEWELGTYCGAWRVVQNGRVVCGSQDVVDSMKELDSRLRSTVALGRITQIYMPSALDIRLAFDDRSHVDILATSAECMSDELFHVFCPDDLFVEYSVTRGWRTGKSSVPWV